MELWFWVFDLLVGMVLKFCDFGGSGDFRLLTCLFCVLRFWLRVSVLLVWSFGYLRFWDFGVQLGEFCLVSFRSCCVLLYLFTLV